MTAIWLGVAVATIALTIAATVMLGTTSVILQSLGGVILLVLVLAACGLGYSSMEATFSGVGGDEKDADKPGGEATDRE